MPAKHSLTLTTPELDVHHAGTVVFAGRTTPGSIVELVVADRMRLQQTANSRGIWRIRRRLSAGPKRVEVTSTSPGGEIQTLRRTVNFFSQETVKRLSSLAPGQPPETLPGPPIITHSRIGIGVTDPVWWDFRYKTLEHITLPSLINAHVPEHRILLVVDTAIEQDRLEQLKRIIARSGGADFIDIAFTDSLWTYPETIENYARLTFGDVPLILHGIDDDDGVGRDFFRRAREKVAAENPAKYQVHTFPFGLVFNMQLFKVRLSIIPWSSLSQFAYGRPRIIHTLRAQSHNMIQAVAEERGWIARVHHDAYLSYLYTHHKQSDSEYVKRLETMRLNDQAFTLGHDQAAKFGLHRKELAEISEKYNSLPGTTGRTWQTSTQYRIAERNILRASREIKRLRLEATQELVERSVEPTLPPSLSTRVKDPADPTVVDLYGTYLADHYLRITVDDRNIASIHVPQDGEWRYPMRLQPGTHSVTLTGVSPLARISESVTAEVVVASAEV